MKKYYKKTIKIIILFSFLLFSANLFNQLNQTELNTSESHSTMINDNLILSETEVNKLPRSASIDDWNYEFNNNRITSKFPTVLTDGNLVVAVSESISNSIYLLTYPSTTEYQWFGGGNYAEIYIKDTKLNSAGNLFVTGNTKLNNPPDENQTVFYFIYNTDSISVTSSGEITLSDDCYFLDCIVLENGNYLLLIKYFSYADGGLKLFEIDSDTGNIEWSKDFSGTTTYYNEAELGLKYIHQTSSGKIVLVAQNSTNDGIFISNGNIGGSWTNKTISKNTDLKGCVIDSNEDIHLALERENEATTETDLDIIKMTTSGSIESNYTFNSASKTFDVRKFTINEGMDLPFLVYAIYGIESNSGLGYCYINGESIEQNVEYSPSSSNSYRYSDLKIFNGDIFFSICTLYSSYASVEIIRVGNYNWVSDLSYSTSFSELVSVEDITKGNNDDKIWLQIADTEEDAGIYSFDMNSGSQEDYISVGTQSILCDFLYYENDGEDYIAMYGLEGDFVNYNCDALLATYDISGNELTHKIRTDTEGVNENWEWAKNENEGIYLVGLQTTSDYSDQTLIVGKYSMETLFTKELKPCGNIFIDSDDDINYYKDDGIITGEGNSADPYVIEYIKIDGNEEFSSPDSTGILIKIDRNFIIRNCSISNIYGQWLSAIHLEGLNNFAIQDTNISSCYFGIGLHNSKNGIIERNKIDHCQENGIYIGGIYDGGNFWGSSDNNKIRENTITNTEQCQDDWGNGAGIFLEAAMDNEIYNNVITSNCHGVYLAHCYSDCENPIVQRNNIHDNDLSDNSNGPFNEISSEFENIFKDNEGAEDFPASGSDVFDDLPGYDSIILLSLSFGVITSLILAQKKKKK